jgi:hypothetical protein
MSKTPRIDRALFPYDNPHGYPRRVDDKAGR